MIMDLSLFLELLIYPIKKAVLLLFSLQIGNVTLGSLMVAAGLISVILGALVGLHALPIGAANYARSQRIKKARQKRSKGG